MRKNIKFIVLSVVILSVLLSACDLSQIRIGWAGSSSLNRMAYKYTRFSGMETKQLSLKEGDHLELEYELEVEKGLLKLSLYDPDTNLILEKTFSENTAGEERFMAPSDGKYQILLEGRDAGGSFDIGVHVNE